MKINTQTTSEERVFAALAHGSAVMMGWGIVISLGIWITQREKSQFIKFHALQAMSFQLTQTLFSMIMSFVLMLVYFVVAFITGFHAVEVGADNFLGIFAGQMIIMAGMFLIMAVYPIVGLVAAALIFAKRDFRYPLLCSWLEKYLSQDSESETIEDVAHE